MASQTNTEVIILSGIVHDDEYRRKVIPHILPKFFGSEDTKTVWNVVSGYFTKYNEVPTEEAVKIELSNITNISDDIFNQCIELTTKLYGEKAKEAVNKTSAEWMKNTTEKYCLDRSVHLAVVEAIDIIQGEDKQRTPDALPDILQKALSVSFDTEIGHDYLSDAEKRFEFYHTTEIKIPSPLALLNDYIGGGFFLKTLNMLVMPTGVGKTHMMTYFSSKFLEAGYNVLYITCEMSEERISERVDACLMDVDMDMLKKIPKKTFMNKMDKIKSKTSGRLIVKEYPLTTINVNHLRSLLDELKTKKNFEPQIVVVDYINLMASTRFRNSENSYLTVKSVAEELRGLMVERNLMGLSASQTNRGGQGASDFDLTEVSESHGLSMTADFVLAGILTDEMEKLGQLRLKILKSRYGAKGSFIVGMNRSKMTFFDMDLNSSNNVSNAPTPAPNISGYATKTPTEKFKF